jgi:HEAT repeat protein
MATAALPQLEKAAQDDNHPGVRAAAAEAIKKIKG